MKKLLLISGFLLAMICVVIVWLVYPRTPAMSSFTVVDVRHPDSFQLGTNSSEKYVHAITIRGSGEIDGDATITMMASNDAPYRVEKLRGKIDFEWRGDWYSKTAQISYEPINVQGGELVLHYRFHDQID